MSGNEIRKEWDRMGYNTEMFSDAQIETVNSFLEQQMKATGASYATALDELYRRLNISMPYKNNVKKITMSSVAEAERMLIAPRIGRTRMG